MVYHHRVHRPFTPRYSYRMHEMRLQMISRHLLRWLRASWKVANSRGYPTIVTIETHGLCNRRCRYCPRKDEAAFMEERVFRKIIMELREWGYKGDISLHGYNEPLLDPRLARFTRYIRKHLPGCYQYVNTNGDYLTDETARELFASGVKKIIVSLHDPPSINPYLYRDYHPGIVFHDYRNATRKTPLFNRAGHLEIEGEPLRWCYFPVGLYIRWDGSVVRCSNDVLKEWVVANVKGEEICTIWNDADFSKWRRDRLNGRANHPMCDICRIEKR